MKYVLIITIFLLSQRGYSQVDGIIDKKINQEIGKYMIDSSMHVDPASILGNGDKANRFRVNPNFVANIIRNMFLTDTEIKLLKPTANQKVFNLTLGRWQTYTSGAWK